MARRDGAHVGRGRLGGWQKVNGKEERDSKASGRARRGRRGEARRGRPARWLRAGVRLRPRGPGAEAAPSRPPYAGRPAAQDDAAPSGEQHGLQHRRAHRQPAAAQPGTLRLRRLPHVHALPARRPPAAAAPSAAAAAARPAARPPAARPAGGVLLGPGAGHGAHLHPHGHPARHLRRPAPGGRPQVRPARQLRQGRRRPGRRRRREGLPGQGRRAPRLRRRRGRAGVSGGRPRRVGEGGGEGRGGGGGGGQRQGGELLHGQRPGLQLRRQSAGPGGAQGGRGGRGPGGERPERGGRQQHHVDGQEPPAAHGLHQRAAPGAGEGVPLQEVPLADGALADRARPQAQRGAGQDLVPEPARQVETGQGRQRQLQDRRALAEPQDRRPHPRPRQPVRHPEPAPAARAGPALSGGPRGLALPRSPPRPPPSPYLLRDAPDSGQRTAVGTKARRTGRQGGKPAPDRATHTQTHTRLRTDGRRAPAAFGVDFPRPSGRHGEEGGLGGGNGAAFCSFSRGGAAAARLLCFRSLLGFVRTFPRRRPFPSHLSPPPPEKRTALLRLPSSDGVCINLFPNVVLVSGGFFFFLSYGGEWNKTEQTKTVLCCE